MHVSDLFIYPVKALAGVRMTSAKVDQLGLAGDRRFMVVDETGRFLTQRTLPRMALIRTTLADDHVTLQATSVGEVRVARNDDPAAVIRRVSVWGSHDLEAEDCGDEPAFWLSDFLHVRCRLVRIGARFHRALPKPKKARLGDGVAFNDAYPFLVISEASLHDLNDRLAARGEETLPMDRFRPNLVIAGVPPYAEDTWPRIRVGDVVLRPGGPCARCVVTTTNQQTAERGKEPLRTLATYRRDPDNPSDVNFGQNFIHETKSGVLNVGMHVEVVRE